MPLPTAPSGPLKVLAFDTATELLAVALQGPLGPLHAVTAGGAQASAGLLPQIHALLRQAGMAMAEIDCIAFGRGPGAFTGLRTACAVAQGLGLGLGRPVLPIDSLLIVAEDAQCRPEAERDASALVGVAMDARMDEAYAAVYALQDGAWRTAAEPALYTLPALAAAWAGLPLELVAGSALRAFGPRLALPPGACQVPQEHDRAAALLRLAVQGALRGEGRDAAEALPLYLRDKVALTTSERDALRQQTAAAANPASAAAAPSP